MGFRLRLAGYRCYFQPRAVCEHEVGASYGTRSWRLLYNSARNNELVFLSNMPGRLLWLHLPAHVAFNTLQAGFKLLRGQIIAHLAGKCAVLGHLGWVARRRRERGEAVSAAAGAAGTGEAVESLRASLIPFWFRLHVLWRFGAHRIAFQELIPRGGIVIDETRPPGEGRRGGMRGEPGGPGDPGEEGPRRTG